MLSQDSTLNNAVLYGSCIPRTRADAPSSISIIPIRHLSHTLDLSQGLSGLILKTRGASALPIAATAAALTAKHGVGVIGSWSEAW